MQLHPLDLQSSGMLMHMSILVYVTFDANIRPWHMAVVAIVVVLLGQQQMYMRCTCEQVCPC